MGIGVPTMHARVYMCLPASLSLLPAHTQTHICIEMCVERKREKLCVYVYAWERERTLAKEREGEYIGLFSGYIGLI